MDQVILRDGEVVKFTCLKCAASLNPDEPDGGYVFVNSPGVSEFVAEIKERIAAHDAVSPKPHDAPPDDCPHCEKEAKDGN